LDLKSVKISLIGKDILDQLDMSCIAGARGKRGIVAGERPRQFELLEASPDLRRDRPVLFD
jgi:hypothetical protein